MVGHMPWTKANGPPSLVGPPCPLHQWFCASGATKGWPSWTGPTSEMACIQL